MSFDDRIRERLARLTERIGNREGSVFDAMRRGRKRKIYHRAGYTSALALVVAVAVVASQTALRNDIGIDDFVDRGPPVVEIPPVETPDDDPSPSPSPSEPSESPSPSPRKRTTAPKESVAMKGTITDEKGKRIAGVCVDVWVNPDEEYTLWRGVARTGADGRYSITHKQVEGWLDFVEPDGHLATVSARFRDCRSRPTLAWEWYGGGSEPGTANIPLRRSSTAVIDAALAPGGAVAGTVRDREGNPIPNVCVWLWDEAKLSDQVDEGRTIAPYAMLLSGDDGRYRFGGLASGAYRMSFSSFDSGCVGSCRTSFRKEHERCSATHPKIEAQWYDGRPHEWPENSDPGFEFPDVDVIEVQAPETITGIDATLDFLGLVTGTVTVSDGSGCDEDEPYVYWISGDDESTGVRGGADAGCDGRYRLYLPAGSYKISFGRSGYAREWYDDQPSATTATVVEVTAKGTVSGIDAELAPE